MGVTSGCGDYSSMYSLHTGGTHTTGMLSCLSLLTAEQCKILMVLWYSKESNKKYQSEESLR